jgi:protein-S-isoprenylcysteine O-methyltransferase Ste14
MSRSRPIFGGIVVLYFIIALEVLVMISPFAAFFYSVFNPVLLFLARSSATRWLADFFLPHMVLPPGLFLKAVRVAGSVLLVAGGVAFLACAGQVYLAKLTRRGAVLGGPYGWIRHPQYLSLAATGLGLAILWPRFLTVVLWNVMVGLYVLLARDEERRMLSAHGDQYRAHMTRTGMFLPRSIEDLLGRIPGPRSPAVRSAGALAALLAATVIVDWIFHPFRHLEGALEGARGPHRGLPAARASPGDLSIRGAEGDVGPPGQARGALEAGGDHEEHHRSLRGGSRARRCREPELLDQPPRELIANLGRGVLDRARRVNPLDVPRPRLLGARLPVPGPRRDPPRTAARATAS